MDICRKPAVFLDRDGVLTEEKSYIYTVSELTVFSYAGECRKPGIGLITQACRDYNIDIDKSYMVGDRASDIIAGQRAGLKTVLLESGYGTAGLEADVVPDYILADLRGMLPLL